MEFEFVSNTGCFLKHKNLTLGMDLWLTQGPFEGSWFHYPELRETKNKLDSCDYIYISHIHPDHFDISALSNVKKDATFIIPNYFNNLLENKIKTFGFTNCISLAPNETFQFDSGLKVRLFGQFINNLFASAEFGNLIDSSIFIEWDGYKILNCNDNYPDITAAEQIKKEYKKIDLALIPHSASGPYPASFNNLKHDEKKNKAQILQEKYIKHFCDISSVIDAKYTIPMAAEYVIAGRNYEKNQYLGLASADDAVESFNKISQKNCAIRMDCGSILNLSNGNLSGKSIRPIDSVKANRFAKKLKDIPYSYDWHAPVINKEDFIKLFKESRKNLWNFQKKLNWFKDYEVFFDFGHDYYLGFNFSNIEIIQQINQKYLNKKEFMECKLPFSLFHLILTNKIHWNNAEGGLHIEFYRKPDIYIPEIFILMSFLYNNDS